MGQCNFHKVQIKRIIRDIPITYITTTHEDLDWIDFADIFDIINTRVLTYEYALHKILEITHLLFFWFKHKKNKIVPLVGPNCIPPSFWRLGLGKLGTS